MASESTAHSAFNLMGFYIDSEPIRAREIIVKYLLGVCDMTSSI